MRYTISVGLATLAALPAMAEVPQVVTDIPPVHALVATVMGDLGEPLLLLDRGGSAHEFQLRPSQAAELSKAGLVVWVGPSMTPWLDRALVGLNTEAAQLRLLDAEGTHLQDFGASEAHDHGDDGHGHEDQDDAHEEDHAEEGHEEAGHAHEGLDPHAWLDPENGRQWLGVIAAELARLDPENAATYAANAEAGQAAIAALDGELAAQLAPVQGKPFVVFHEAYGYFAGHYGLNVAGAVALGDATAPGAAHLVELRSKVAGGGSICLFPEAGHDPKLVAQMAEAGGARIGATLDPAGVAVQSGADAYQEILRNMATALVECLATE